MIYTHHIDSVHRGWFFIDYDRSLESSQFRFFDLLHYFEVDTELQFVIVWFQCCQ